MIQVSKINHVEYFSKVKKEDGLIGAVGMQWINDWFGNDWTRSMRFGYGC